MSRCYNPSNKNFADYGGRGIRVSSEFQSFASWLKYIGTRPEGRFSLDRINVNGHYERGNLRWASDKEQARNKRNSRQVENGLPLMDYCEQFGLDYQREYRFRFRRRKGKQA